MRPQKRKKLSLDSLSGHPYMLTRKSRAPSLSLHFCLLEIRSKNSRLPPYLAGSSWLSIILNNNERSSSKKLEYICKKLKKYSNIEVLPV